MQDFEPRIGRVCHATAGRDAGKYFLIFEIVDSDYVLIVDGKERSISKPKKKKLKHLKMNAEVIEKIAEKIVEGKQIHDPEIKSVLRPFS